MFRVLAFFRASADDKIPDGLSQTSFRAFYYQQISYYFCSGDGKIPGIIGIRFYLVGSGIPHFFDTDKYGQPLPPISEYNSRLPLYEQKCSSK
jgi:hypothetical protein